MLALLYVVVLSTLLGFGVWAWLLGRHPASTVAPFTLLVPVVGIAAAWLALGEVPSGGRAGGRRGRARRAGAHRGLDSAPARARRLAHHALTHVALALAAAFLALTRRAAQAAPTTYRVENVRTAAQRAAVAQHGRGDRRGRPRLA